VMDGLAAASVIQQAQKVPILFITSHADSERTKLARKSGPFDCLLKPLTEKELAIGIELSLCRHRYEAEQNRLLAQVAELQELNSKLASIAPNVWKKPE
jgi:FixJ family two-component response regulator